VRGQVLVKDRDVRLPNGEVVESGLTFRNEFHLLPYSSADLFVPCGGRPEAVNIKNVKKVPHLLCFIAFSLSLSLSLACGCVFLSLFFPSAQSLHDSITFST
jgi:hypothetical protein